MSLLTTLTPILPFAPLLLTTTNVVNDVNEFITFSTLLHPSHRRSIAPILPSVIQVLAHKSTLFHVPLHLVTVASIGTCIYKSVPPNASSFWWAALALEIGHWVFVWPAIKDIKAFEEGSEKGGEEKYVRALAGLYSVQWWRFWVANLPGLFCCWMPVLSVLGM